MPKLEKIPTEEQQTESLDESLKKLHQTNLKLAEESHNRFTALEELRESREMYRRFFQTAGDAVFIAAEDGRWIDMNESALRLFGYDQREDIWTDTMVNFYWDPGQGKEYVQQLKIDGGVKDFPLKFRKRNGSSFDGLISATPYEAGGKVIGYQGFIRDITYELKVEKENQRLIKNLSILDSLALETAKLLEPDQVFRSITEHIKEMVDLVWIRFLKYDEIKDQFVLEFDWKMNAENPSGIREDVEKDQELKKLIDEITRTKQTQSVAMKNLKLDNLAENEIQALAQIDHGEDQDLSDIHMFLVPILVDDQIKGIVQCFSKPEENQVLDEKKLLSRVGNLVAIRLENAYHYRQSQVNLKNLSSLQRLQQIILDNLSLPTTMDMLVDQVVLELEVDAVDVLYFHPGHKSLRPLAQHGFRQNIFQDIDIEIGEGLAGRTAELKTITQVRNLAAAQEPVIRSREFSSEGFVTYFGVPLLVKNRMVGVLEVFNRTELDPDDEWMDLLKLVAGLAATGIDLQNLTNDLDRARIEISEAFDGVILGWAEALELRGIEPEGHADRIVDLMERLVLKMGLDDDSALDDIRRGVLLHDIGKMGIPDSVLLKGSQLNEKERKAIGRHPVDAYELLKSVKVLDAALEIPLYHHERWDGKGYPYQLAAEEIPLSARQFAIVDVWDAMLSDRPYREAFSREDAIQHIKGQAGKHFDPEVLGAFLEILEEE